MCTRAGAPAPRSAAAPAAAAQQAPATPTGLAAAQDFDAIAAHMATKHNITVAPALARSISVETLRTACEGIEAVINEFPAVANYIKSISGGARGRRIAQVNPDGDIQINNQIYKTTQTLDATVRQNLQSGYHPAGSGAKEFTAHEVGHMLGMMLSKITVRQAAARAVAAGQPAPSQRAIRSAEIADWWNNTTSDTFIAKAVANINRRAQRNNIPQTTQAALVSHVSGYAKQDTGEALAECVADYVANGRNARRLSREVWRLLKQELT